MTIRSFASVARATTCLALLVTLSCSRAHAPPSILFVLIDTLRYDYLGCDGFRGPISPAIDALAREAVVFSRCYAPAPWTKPSIASAFTSLHPTNHGVTNHDGRWRGAGSPDIVKGVLGASAQTLAETLKAKGYQTAGFVANPWTTAEYGFDQGFETFSTTGFYPPGREVLQRTASWFKTRDRQRPFFLYLHFMDVHGPYRAPESDYEAIRGSASVQTPVRLSKEDWEAIPEYLRKPAWTQAPGGELLATWRGRYAAGVRVVDRELGTFFDQLRESGVLKHTLVVVTSDHGEELFDHGGWNHGTTLYEEQLRVPLVIRPPGGLKEGRKCRDLVSLLDLYPTLAGLAGVAVPNAAQGRDLGPLLAGTGKSEPRVLLGMATREGPDLVALRAGDYKLILDQDSGGTALFNLRIDPGETQDLDTTGEADLAERLTVQLRTRIDEIKHAGLFEAAAQPPSAETQELLRSLGYVN
jgi:arylsulfatase A-like enzyme